MSADYMKGVTTILKKEKNVTIYYALVQLTYWFGFAAIGAFASAFLLHAGLRNTTIGFVLAVAALVAAFLQPVVGSAIDRFEKLSNKKVLTASAGVLSLAGITLFAVPGLPLVLTVIVYGIGYVMIQMSQPFVNAIGMECMNVGYRMHYGITRASGSLGYALSAYITGMLVAKIDISVIPAVIMISFGAMEAVLVIMSPEKIRNGMAVENNGTGDSKLNPVSFLKRYPYYAVMLLGLVCIYYSHGMINTFSLQILETIGGDSESLGTATFLAAMVEMVPMLFFAFLQKHFRSSKLIISAGFFFTLKAICTFFAPSVGWFYCAQLLQLPAWGVLAVTLVYFVNERIDKENAAQGQAFAGMSFSIGNVLATLISGAMIDGMGIRNTLLFGAGVGAVGAILLALTADKVNSK